MKVTVDVNMSCTAWEKSLPGATELCVRAVDAALAAAADRAGADAVEVSVLLADNAVVSALNRDYRGRDGATNVLSFAAMDSGSDPSSTGPRLLGDIVLAQGTVADEARARGLAIGDHAAHLLVHGVLHLLGYDHRTVDTAETMESLEIRILAGLGIGNPYDAAPVGMTGT